VQGLGGLAGNDQNAWGKAARTAVLVGLLAFIVLFWAAVVWAIGALASL
jgi:hypothetical protein